MCSDLHISTFLHDGFFPVGHRTCQTGKILLGGATVLSVRQADHNFVQS
jgi:hypothetical protein